MFGTRRFGRNISNVQQEHKMPGKQMAVKKQRSTQQGNQLTVSKTSVIINGARSPKVQNKPKSLFDQMQHTAAPDSFEVDSTYVDPMSIDDLPEEIPHEDIDQYDTHDPQFVSEYINDIMEFLKEKEIAVQISEDYCSKQKDIKPRQRNQLIRWMAEVYVQLKLLAETYFLAVNIVDQVLDNCAVSRKKLHLIGVTAIFVASKYEETWAPPLNDLRICCDYAFSEEEIIRMEREILNRINFNLCIPAPIHFLRRYSKAGHSDAMTHTIAKFLSEMTCQSYSMIKFLPSQTAAAAVLLARQIRGGYDELWDANLRHYSGYELEDLVECGQTLTAFIYKEVSTRDQPGAIVRKYSEKKMLSVATLVAKVLCAGK